MYLKILLPYKVFADLNDIQSIVVENSQGSVGVLPLRQDCVIAIVPGILNYKTESGENLYVAVDEGIMVKEGKKVMVSVRNAIGGTDLGLLHQTVQKEFIQLNEDELTVRSALAKLESSFMKKIRKLNNRS